NLRTRYSRLRRVALRSRALLRPRPLRGGGPLSRGARMGGHRRGRLVAAHQARLAAGAGGGRRAGCLYARAGAGAALGGGIGGGGVAMLELRNVTKRVGAETHIDGVSLTLED